MDLCVTPVEAYYVIKSSGLDSTYAEHFKILFYAYLKLFIVQISYILHPPYTIIGHVAVIKSKLTVYL